MEVCIIIEFMKRTLSTIGLTVLLVVGGGVLGAQIASAPVSGPETVEVAQEYQEPVIVPETAVWEVETPAVEVTLPQEPEPTHVSVQMRGHQEEIDRCAGPVLSTYSQGLVIGEHNHCGGAYVLDLNVGDTVVIEGLQAGTYVVSGSKDVEKGASSAVLDFAPLYLQTCYFHDDDLMRLVGLTPAD